MFTLILGIGLRQFDDLNKDRALERERDLYKQMKSEMERFFVHHSSGRLESVYSSTWSRSRDASI